jgi:IMP dehydrogenase
MTARVQDIMSARVLSVTPHQTVGHVRDLMTRHRVQALPVVGPEGDLLGIVTATDILRATKETTPVSRIMTREVTTIPEYAEVSKAARAMRNKRIHHLVVTREGKVLGIVSTYDLLKLVEEHRFVPRNAPSTPGRPRDKGGSHRKSGR